MDVEIGTVRGDEVTAVLTLLAENNLPTEGLSDHLPTTLVARHDGGVVGSAALELYGQSALLRSVAVDATYRGNGLGVRMSVEAIELGKRLGVTDLYLLTETAVHFFPKFGFQQVARVDVPEAVQNSLEFTQLCPDSAVAMVLPIG
jgi:amino-acid N-acetyltransferase